MLCHADITNVIRRQPKESNSVLQMSTLDQSSTTKNTETCSPALENLRKIMSGLGIDAFIVPTDDPHLSEYTPAFYNRRAFISGFTGSAGTALVLKDKAYLWTDGRYFLQAEQELSSEWTLMKSGQKGTPTMEEFLTDHFKGTDSVIGIDPLVHSAEAASNLKKKLEGEGHSLKTLEGLPNPVDEVWEEGRPEAPTAPCRVHPIEYAGESIQSKVGKVRAEFKKAGANAVVFGMLDEIAYLYNIRGGDIAYCPVTLSYAVITETEASIYIDSLKITEDVQAHLSESGVTLKDYEELLADISKLAENNQKVMLDKARINYAIFNKLSQDQIVANTSPLQLPKSIKNDAEIAGMKAAHARDGAAECEFLCWLEEEVAVKKRSVSEVEVDEKLNERRAARPGFLEPSFPTIAGAGENGAIIHYRAEPETCGYLDDTKMFLLDSGAQYVDGTTDVTRTMHFGEPTAWQKECYTRVLKGNIGVDNAVFPEDTPGFMLDSFARQSLWSIGIDYAHGTGHGVGAALNVHEGPHSISPRYANKVALQPGMVVSNEPGYYESHNFGIRIENLLLVKEAGMKYDVTGKKFLCFEKLTKIPIQKSLIDTKLMSSEELDWLDDYHKDVWETVSPLVEGKTKEWLEKATSPIDRA